MLGYPCATYKPPGLEMLKFVVNKCRFLFHPQCTDNSHVCPLCYEDETAFYVGVQPFVEWGFTFQKTFSGNVHSNDTATAKIAVAQLQEGNTPAPKMVKPMHKCNVISISLPASYPYTEDGTEI